MLASIGRIVCFLPMRVAGKLDLAVMDKHIRLMDGMREEEETLIFAGPELYPSTSFTAVEYLSV